MLFQCCVPYNFNQRRNAVLFVLSLLLFCCCRRRFCFQRCVFYCPFYITQKDIFFIILNENSCSEWPYLIRNSLSFLCLCLFVCVEVLHNFFNTIEIFTILFITKTRLFKYIENFTTKKNKNFQKKILLFFIFLLKT